MNKIRGNNVVFTQILTQFSGIFCAIYCALFKNSNAINSRPYLIPILELSISLSASKSAYTLKNNGFL